MYPTSRRQNIGDHSPVRDPCLSEFSEKHDLDFGCSVEPTLLLHLAVVLAADARPHNNTTCGKVSIPSDEWFSMHALNKIHTTYVRTT